MESKAKRMAGGPGREGAGMETRAHPIAAEPRLYHIGDVATLTGLTEHALRAWERVDLLSPRRSPAGVRQYTEDDIARIRLIIRTLDSRRLSRRAVAALLRSGELRPDAADYAHDAIGSRRRRSPTPGSAGRERAPAGLDGDEGRMQRLLGSIARLSGAVASGRPLEEVLSAVCRETCQAFGASDCVLWLVEPGEQRTPTSVMAMAAYGPHSRAALDPASPLRVALDDRRAVMARAIRTRRGIIVNAFDVEPSAHPELRALLPGAALLVVPLLRPDGEPVGALALREAVEQERFDASDLELARLFAIQATVAIETARLQAGMRAARQEAETERARWQATVENMPELVRTCDTEARITFVNAAYEKLCGKPADPDLPLEAAARYYGLFTPDGSAVCPPESLPLRRSLTENRVVRGIELQQQTSDDGRRLISWDAAPMRATDGELLGAVAVGRDITEEQRRGERERRLTAVTRAAAGMPRAPEGGSRVAQALRALVEHSELALITATLYTYNAQRGALQQAGSYGAESTLALPPAVPLDQRHHWWEPVTRGAMYSSPGSSVPGWLMDIAPSVRRSQRRAWATAPLRSGAEFLGVLAVGLTTPHLWDEAEREWFEACAGAVALALANDRLYAAAQRRAEELEAVLNLVDAGISMVAADGRMLVRNAAAVEITGRGEYTGALSESAEVYGLRDELTGERVPLAESPLGRALQGEQVRDALLVMRDPLGRERVTQSSSTPVRDAAGQVVVAVTVFREVDAGGRGKTQE